MSKFDMHFALLWAQGIARPDGSQPLLGKEKMLLDMLRHAEHAHNDALRVDGAADDMSKEGPALRTRLVGALTALQYYKSINLAFPDQELDKSSDPELDKSHYDPTARDDLPGMLRRAIERIDKVLDDPLRTRKSTRVIPGHEKEVRYAGLLALVEVLRTFWICETGMKFGRNFREESSKAIDESETKIDQDRERPEEARDPDKDKARLVPRGPAARFVCAVAQRIDKGYTGNHCANAMRPRKKR